MFLRASARQNSPGAVSCLYRLWSEVAHSDLAVRSRDVCKVPGERECEPEVLSVLDIIPTVSPGLGTWPACLWLGMGMKGSP